MMAKKRPFFYYLSFGLPSIPWSWFPSSGLLPWLRVHRSKWPFSYYLRFGDVSGGLGFFRGSGCGGTLHPLSLVPYPLSLHPSPVKSLANKKRARLGPFLLWCWSLALCGRSFGSFLYPLGLLVGFVGAFLGLFPVLFPSAG